MTENEDKRIEELTREIIGLQEMLAFVLKVTGPVTVTKEMLVAGLPAGAQIKVDDDVKRDLFVFSLEENE